jgi:hypothetical protein
LVSLSLSSSSLWVPSCRFVINFVALDVAECPWENKRGELFRPCSQPRGGSCCSVHTRVPFLGHNSSSMMRLPKICLSVGPLRPPRPGRNRCSWGSCHHSSYWRCRNHLRRPCSFCRCQWLRAGLAVLGRGVDRDPSRRLLRNCGRSCMHG